MGNIIGDTATFATWGAIRSVIANGETAGVGYSFNVEYTTGLYPTGGKFLRAINTPRTFYAQPGLVPIFSGGYQLVGGFIEDKARDQIIGETATFDTSETLSVTSDAFTGGQSFSPTLSPSYILSLGKFTRIT
jgi:hypothetical protein